jgi:hypothetical protein
MGLITDEQYLRLCRAYYGSPQATLPQKTRQGADAAFSVNIGSAWELPGVQLAKALREVKVTGVKQLVARSDEDFPRKNVPPNPDYLSAHNPWNIHGKAKVDLPPGDCTVTFLVDLAALLPNTAPQMAVNKPGQAKNWPKGRMRWTEEVSVPITVTPSDVSPIALVSDPAMDPKTTNVIHVKSIEVTRRGAGPHVLVDLWIDGKPVACSFDMVLRLDGQEHALGAIVASANGHSTSNQTVDLKALGSEVRSADLIFRPNPSRAEGTPGIDRVWGGTVELSNLPVRRYDLEAEAAATQPAAGG